MRDRIASALKEAQKAQDKRKVSTLRMVSAAITDRDIALRGKGKPMADEGEIAELLVKMVKQREESARLYAQGGRPELEQQELEEIALIREFLPRTLSEAETADAIRHAIAESGAQTAKDMGKVMAILKERYRGQIDMAKAGPVIKAALSGG